MLFSLPEELIIMICSWISVSLDESVMVINSEIKTIISLMRTCKLFDYLKNYYYMLYFPIPYNIRNEFLIWHPVDGQDNQTSYRYLGDNNKEFYGYWDIKSCFWETYPPSQSRNVFQINMNKSAVERPMIYKINKHYFNNFILWKEKLNELKKLVHPEILDHIQSCDSTQKQRRILIWKTPFPMIKVPNEWIDEIKSFEYVY